MGPRNATTVVQNLPGTRRLNAHRGAQIPHDTALRRRHTDSIARIEKIVEAAPAERTVAEDATGNKNTDALLPHLEIEMVETVEVNAVEDVVVSRTETEKSTQWTSTRQSHREVREPEPPESTQSARC
jgi:hypothetical protein